MNLMNNLIHYNNENNERQKIEQLALNEIDKTKCLILELSTGYGKTKLAIDLVNYICDRVFKKEEELTTILILVAKVVHKQTWENEIKKWGGIKSDYITIECYESFKKYKDHYFDVVVLDEVQHLSDKRKEILDSLNIKEAIIGLSATIKKDLRNYFLNKYQAKVIKCGIRNAIDNNILPEPMVYLIPLTLDSTKYSYKAKRFKQKFITTQKGYYDNISSIIEWYKNKFFNTGNERIKNLWLSQAGNRLKWLSEQKEGIVLALLNKLKNCRTLTFCNNIAQTERLGKYNITSKNKNSLKNLDMFNNSKIKHITACNILNEGVNLTNCRIGIFCNLNSSEIIVKQRIGRLLRHKAPIIIVPYFRFTREEELLNKMLEEYNKDFIKIINNMDDIII